MSNQSKIEENNFNKNNFSTKDHYSMFLNLCSSETKYMVPWAQYEETMKPERKFDSPKLEHEEKVFDNVISFNETFI